MSGSGPTTGRHRTEADRSRLYAWFRKHTDEALAEYFMSCLAPAPLSDLVTKDYLATQFELLRNEIAAEAAARREADRKASDAAQRDAHRKTAKREFHWTIGAIIVSNGLLTAAVGAIVALA